MTDQPPQMSITDGATEVSPSTADTSLLTCVLNTRVVRSQGHDVTIHTHAASQPYVHELASAVQHENVFIIPRVKSPPDAKMEIYSVIDPAHEGLFLTTSIPHGYPEDNHVIKFKVEPSK